MSFCGRHPKPRRRRNPIRERRPKWVNGRIKRYGLSRVKRGRIAFLNAMLRFMLPVVSDARNNSTELWKMLVNRPAPTVTGRFIVTPVHGGRMRPAQQGPLSGCVQP